MAVNSTGIPFFTEFGTNKLASSDPHTDKMDACLARLALLGVELETVAAPTENLACTVAMPIRQGVNLYRTTLKAEMATCCHV
jgi:hypothetical protein